MLIYLNTSQTKTQVSLCVSLKISVRLVGGKKPFGHANKILETLAKSNTSMPSLKTTPVVSKSSIKPKEQDVTKTMPKAYSTPVLTPVQLPKISPDKDLFVTHDVIMNKMTNNDIKSDLLKNSNIMKDFIGVFPTEVKQPSALPHTLDNSAKQNKNQMLKSLLEEKDLQVIKTNENLKPSKIQKSFKETLDDFKIKNAAENSTENPKSFISHLGNMYTTKIKQNTKADDLTTMQLSEDLFARGLVEKHIPGKNDHAFISMSIHLENNTTMNINLAVNDLKLTNMGHAYNSELNKMLENLLPHIKFENVVFKIIVPPQVSDDTYITTGEFKHLLIAYDTVEKTSYTIGYLTSKSSAQFLSEEQYKTFEKKQLGEFIMNKKSQNIVLFKEPRFMEQNLIKKVKFSEQYIKTLPQKSIEMLNKQLIKQQMQQPTMFPTKGITKEDALKICKYYDIVAEECAKTNPNFKIKHPLTEDQKNQKKKGLDKQKKAQSEKENFKHNIKESKISDEDNL